MFQRQSLTVSISEEGSPTPPPTNIRHMIMAFAINDRYHPMTSLTYGVDFLMSAGLRTWIYNTTTKELEMSVQDIQLEQCQSEHFGSLADDFAKVANIEATVCIARNQSDELWTIQGQLGSPVFKFIAIDFYCVPNGTNCQDSFLSSNVMMFYASSYLNSGNYENPVMQIPTAIYDRADGQSYHERHMIVTERDIVTDTGLILEDKTTQTDLMINEGPSVIDGINPVKPTIFEFLIRLDSKKITVNRSYRKIFDVLAATTGIASTIGLVCAILIQPYVKIKALNDIVKVVAPNKYVEIEVKDFLKALFGSKVSKQKVSQVLENKKWVVENFDVLKRIKNWNDPEMVQLKICNEDQTALKDYDEKNLCELKVVSTPESPEARI